MVAEWSKMLSQRENAFGPRFESPLGITILIAQKQKYFVAIQIVGRQATCVTYNIELSETL